MSAVPDDMDLPPKPDEEEANDNMDQGEGA